MRTGLLFLFCGLVLAAGCMEGQKPAPLKRAATRSVSTTPGQMALTRTPLGE